MDFTLLFVLIGCLVCIGFFTAILRRLRVLKIKPPKYVYVAFIVALLTWDNVYATLALHYFGMTEGGVRIYKVIEENAKGYYEQSHTLGCAATCSERLLNREFDFIESNVSPANRRFLADRSGLHRFSLAKKGSPLCALYYKKFPSKRGEPYCIASEKIDELKSRYSYHSNNYEMVIPFILKKNSTITDRQTGEKIASALTFMQYAGWLHYLYYGPTMGTIYPADSRIHYKILYNALKPNKD